MFNGQADAVSPTELPLDQVSQLLQADKDEHTATLSNVQLAPRQLVLFPNGFKDDEPEKKRPDYWGGFNPGRGQPVVRISVWARKDRNDRVMLSGATSYPIPGKSEAEMQAETPTLDTLLANGTLTKGVDEKADEGQGQDQQGPRVRLGAPAQLTELAGPRCRESSPARRGSPHSGVHRWRGSTKINEAHSINSGA